MQKFICKKCDMVCEYSSSDPDFDGILPEFCPRENMSADWEPASQSTVKCEKCGTEIPLVNRFEKSADTDDAYLDPCGSCKHRETWEDDMPCAFCLYNQSYRNQICEKV